VEGPLSCRECDDNKQTGPVIFTRNPQTKQPGKHVATPDGSPGNGEHHPLAAFVQPQTQTIGIAWFGRTSTTSAGLGGWTFPSSRVEGQVYE